LKFVESQVSKSRLGAPSLKLLFGVLLESGKRRFPGREDPSEIPGRAAAGAKKPAKEGRLVSFKPV
jgi:hypothetical protein